MTSDSAYQEAFVYLKESQNEIAKVFEEDIRKTGLCKVEKEEKTKIPKEIIDINQEQADDKEINFLIEKIESDVSELLAKKEYMENSLYDSYLDRHKGNYNCHTNDHNENGLHKEDRLKILHKSLSNNFNNIVLPVDRYLLSKPTIIDETDHKVIDAATQRSPSLSPSSTHLTWPSECSSSPCLTSTSDSEFLEEDAQSTSSRNTTFTVNPCTKLQRQQILGSKSLSTPVLKIRHHKVNKQCRSQSDRHLAEIEAAEACKWLRATGFPQYAQLYEDNQFPIDIATAAQDHPLLESDVLHSLFRRLQILNSCAHLHQQKTHTDESEDECCALSDNWTYQSDIRRWSRTTHRIPSRPAGETVAKQEEKDEILDKSTEPPKDRLRRSGTTKFRRRREGVFFSEKENILDTLSQRLNDLKSDRNHVSDSEVTPKHSRRYRTKSFDKSEAWAHQQETTDRVIWHKRPEQTHLVPEENEITLDNDGPHIASLSSTQLQVLRKLALLKLTSHMEKYCPTHRTGWNWDLPKFIRKIKSPAYKDKNIFGVPLTITLQRTGQVLPRQIEEAMHWLQENAADEVGIFRKPGVKSRIQNLHDKVESDIGIDYSDQQCYDVADMVKQYYRELPEVLLTTKLSETFILIFQYVPATLHRESVLCALLLLPNEHIEVLQNLLHFLLVIAKKSQVNQMNENNLAMCFAPTLFHYSQGLKQNLGTPHPKELAENKAGHACLLFFLNNYYHLFRIPQDFINQCNSSEIRDTKAKFLSDLGMEMGGWREYLKECQSNLLREARDKGRGWIPISSHNPKVDIFYRKVADGLPLKLWKISTDVEAPPSEVVRRILRERHIWDNDLQSAKIIAQLDHRTEIFQFVRRNIDPLPNEEYCVLRTWRTDLPKDACIIVETSVEYSDALPIPNTSRAVVLASRYLIEPCGSGKSRLIHFSRVDTMGRTPEWYQKNYGHLCAIFLSNIQNSFYQNTRGPESKV